MSCSTSYLALSDTLDLMGMTYLVLLETAHKENKKCSDSNPVGCLSLGKLYLLYKLVLKSFWFVGVIKIRYENNLRP